MKSIRLLYGSCSKKGGLKAPESLPNIGLQPTAAHASTWCRRG